MEKELLITELVPLLNSLAMDEQDSVRLLTVEPVIVAAEALSHEETKSLLLNTLRNLYSDKSWRVRYVVAEKFVKLAQAVGSDITNSDLIAAFVHVLKDPEAEVRTAACSQIPGLFSNLFCRYLISIKAFRLSFQKML